MGESDASAATRTLQDSPSQSTAPSEPVDSASAAAPAPATASPAEAGSGAEASGSAATAAGDDSAPQAAAEPKAASGQAEQPSADASAAQAGAEAVADAPAASPAPDASNATAEAEEPGAAAASNAPAEAKQSGAPAEASKPDADASRSGAPAEASKPDADASRSGATAEATATSDGTAEAADGAPKKKKKRRRKRRGEDGRRRRRRGRKDHATVRPIAGSWFESKPELPEDRGPLIEMLASRLRMPREAAANALALLDADYTIPFIAKYRGDRTGGLTEKKLRRFRDTVVELHALHARRAEILERLAQELPDSGLGDLVRKASDPRILDDALYTLRTKRRSKGSRAYKARECGLDALAERILAQTDSEGDPTAIATGFVSDDVENAEAALDGARAIIVEQMSLDPGLRKEWRHQVYTKGILVASQREGSGKPDPKYRSFYTYREAVRRVPPHRLLAVERGVRERALDVSIEAPPAVVPAAEHLILKKEGSIWRDFLKACLRETFERFLPTVSKEVRRSLREEAEERSIETFSSNLGHLLLQPPTREAVVAGVDPSSKNSIRLAVVDPKGGYIGSRTLYPFEPKGDPNSASKNFLNFLEDYRVSIVAIGNGSASRQADRFLAGVLKQASDVRRAVVNESGAVVYAASELGKQEFPNQDVSTRAAISIARRLQDPLAELIKVEPRYLGVGPYQHDVHQKLLSRALFAAVVSVVHKVGVELNTCSSTLLEHLSGVDETLAANIVRHREEKGPFAKRADLFEVDKLRPKAYEQLAGFVRIADGSEALDNTDIHPECYRIVEQMCVSIGRTVASVLEDPSEVSRIEPDRFVSERFGKSTIDAIVATLRAPRSDPRDAVEPIVFREDVVELDDLETGMVLDGTVTNVTDFGAFVDIGVHQDGLIHISEMADSFVKHPSEVIRVGDRVKSKVISVDKKARRIGLSIRALEDSSSRMERAGGDAGSRGKRGPGGRGTQRSGGGGGRGGPPSGRRKTGRPGAGPGGPSSGSGRRRSTKRGPGGGGGSRRSDRGPAAPRPPAKPTNRGFRIGDVLNFDKDE